MEELKPQHIEPYLPFMVDVEYTHYVVTGIKKIEPKALKRTVSVGLSNAFEIIHGRPMVGKLHNMKLVLRPLGDLTKKIKHNNEEFVPLEKLQERWAWIRDERGKGEVEEDICYFLDEEAGIGVWFGLDWGKLNDFLPKWIWDKLLEWNFDVFGLKEQGLAVDKDVV